MTRGAALAAALVRIAFGWLFLWAFLDKLFGLGFPTAHGQGWLVGVSPTAGFLGHAATGPLAGFYHGLAGNAAVDWLFMAGLGGIGLALLLGIAVRFAAACGVVLTLLLFSALLPPANNPILDEHVVYAAALLLLIHLPAGDTLGLGRWWSQTMLVRRFPVLR